jgi:tetratricopeptide (TPR) repeat protein
MIAPGQQATVTLRIRYVRQNKKQAVDLNTQGEKLLYSRRSSINPMNIVPVARRQSESDLTRARDLFARALVVDPEYARAAFNLGQVNQLLSDESASLDAYRKAIALDPGDIDSRIQCAAVLIEHGDPDEAIRQLADVLRLDAANDEAYSMLARAYWDKAAWQNSIEQADKALALNGSNAQAHLWRADSLRQLAAVEKDEARMRELYRSAREEYRNFLNLTNYTTRVHEWLAFHFIGLGAGARRHADRQDSYDTLRSSGFLGLCLSEHKVGHPLRARTYCARALRHDPNDPIAYFLLGNVNRDLYNQTSSCGYLTAARGNYLKMIELNADLVESANAKHYLGQIDAILPKLGCKT